MQNPYEFDCIHNNNKRKYNDISIKDVEHTFKYRFIIDPSINFVKPPEEAFARTLDGKMLELKKGGFHMAINTKAPILPIGVKGAFAAKPRNRWWNTR